MKLLIQAKHESSIYELKPGTASSYYFKEGKKSLPERITFSKDDITRVKKTGRVITEVKKGQLAATFKRNEDSHYKAIKRTIFSSVWQATNYPLFFGYADIQGTKDLIIIFCPEQGIIELHLFKGLLEFKNEVLAYLHECLLTHKKRA